jgi:phosphoribosylformylglycinamidine synthase
VNKAMTTDFLTAGDVLVLIGETRPELAGTTLEKVLGRQLSGVPTVDTAKASARYRAVARALQNGLIRSLHDLSDGGLAVAVAESALGGRLGAEVELDLVSETMGDVELLFSETPSRFLASVSPGRWDEFAAVLEGQTLTRIGRVADGSVRVTRGGRAVLEAPLDELLDAWNALEAVR